jgi:uncharacterized membrane protein YdjX (TVP38/TMEM64 family)
VIADPHEPTPRPDAAADRRDADGPRRPASSVAAPFRPLGKPRRRSLQPIAIALAILAGVTLARALGVYDLVRLENLADLRGWVGGLGPWAPILYIGAYAVLELVFVPAFPLTILAGIAFGAAWGTLYAWAGGTLGAVLAFLVARHGVRETVERWVAGHRRLARIDEAVARHGWRILAFTRLVPVFPYNVQNYAYGLTAIRFSTYLLVSTIFMLPGTAAFTLAGDALAEGGASYAWLAACLGAVALLLACLWIVPRRLGRRSGVTDALGGGH